MLYLALALSLCAHSARGFSVGPRPLLPHASSTSRSAASDGGEEIEEEFAKFIGKRRGIIDSGSGSGSSVINEKSMNIGEDLSKAAAKDKEAASAKPDKSSKSGAGALEVDGMDEEPSADDDGLMKELKSVMGHGVDLDSEDDLNMDMDLDLDLDLDLNAVDVVPDFKSKRPVFEAEASKDSDVNAKQSGEKKKPVLLDYLADYDDENELHIPNRIGISTAAWGDEEKGFRNSKKLKKAALKAGKFTAADAQMAFDDLMLAGVTLFETSPAYGDAENSNSAEHILAKCLKNHDSDIPSLISTAYLNSPWQRGAAPMLASVEQSCDRMGVSAVDILQVQNLGWLYPSGSIVNGMNEVSFEVGKSNYVGVQGLSPLRLRRIVDKLDKKFGLIVATNMFEFSLTNRKTESWIKACKTLGVIPLIRNPFDGGLASGKFTASNPGGGVGAPKFSFSQLEKLQPLHSVMDSVTERVKTRLKKDNTKMEKKSGGRFGDMPKINTEITTSQVALNYIITKGGVPLPEVNNQLQAEEVVGCLGWTLDETEMEMLESAADLSK